MGEARTLLSVEALRVGGCRLRSSLRYKSCCPLEESQRELQPLLLLTL